MTTLAHDSIPPAARRATPTHDTVREGLGLGMRVGVATWLWLAILDAVAGTPFRTIATLGGATTFTIIHFVLCAAYGLAIIGIVHASMRTPSVMFAMIFFTILFHGAFAMLTAFVAQLGLGGGAWMRFLAGNAIAAAITFTYVARRHSLRAIFHAAEADLNE